MEKFIKLVKKHKTKGIIGLGQWFGVDNPWSSDFETVGGTISKASSLIIFATAVSGLVAVILLVYGGIKLITSNGDPDEIDKGRNIIVASIIGLIIIFIASMVVTFVIDEVIKI